MLGDIKLQPDTPARNFCALEVGNDISSCMSRSLRVPGRFAGIIADIGPLYHDIMAQIRKSREQGSLIMRRISDLDLDRASLSKIDCFWGFSNALMRLHKRQFLHFVIKSLGKNSFNLAYCLFNITMQKTQVEPYLNQQVCPRMAAQFFLLQPPAQDQAVRWIGLAPREAQVGDFVCQFSGMKRAVIIRQSGDANSVEDASQIYNFSIIGCAGLARDRDTARQVKRAPLGPNELFSVGKSRPITIASEQINIYMDINTAYKIFR